MAGEISSEAREFLLQHVESYEQLEVLLLLCRQRSQPWTPQSVGEALRIATLVAAKALDDLSRARLIDHLKVGRQSSYAFRPVSTKIAATVEQLVRAYDESPLAIIQLMNQNAMDRVRSAAARTFADAFVIDPKRK